ncbi:squalene/phytoene synthase family protein [Sphingomonas sp. AP4-R1]|uniref:squalene/phytoene synthase family protein n=1 Tax=Sphingomonas sp. AP4-R1 TaxID=2735134 RepID=UPI001493CD9F|nr:squalene/phytoene synthase family protein [Sphingomonas sp. AP4-R1]QJU58635.1 squalene/phytoene synthase family protein [Sphingomonas sp. AP4-R1]
MADIPAAGATFPDLADPERALAITYAPAAARPGLAALFALDERLGTIVGTTTEPMIGLMRLAWWREALERLDHGPVPAEPLMAALAEHVLSHGVTGADLSQIEDGWTALLDDEDVVTRHGRERGANLFRIAGRVLGDADARFPAAGEGWALADLAHRHSDPAIRQAARERAGAVLGGMSGGAWAKAGRVLGALAVLARRDVAEDAPRRQGSPGRLARMLALRLTGR